MKHIIFSTPIGSIALVQEGRALCRLNLPGTPLPSASQAGTTDLLLEGETQLLEYFSGQRKTFDLPLAPQGTDFQRRVWAKLREIPYGEIWSYGDLARAVDSPKGFRAVGMANNRNPLSILIPCHRVVGAKGDLVGYGGGLELKQELLRLEGHKLEGNRLNFPKK